MLVAAVVLLFTGPYPSGVFDLVLGLNRWVLRVAAYAGLMTSDYPPFRLDLGPDDPGSSLETKLADGAEVVPDRLVGDTRLTVEPLGAGAVFVGIGPTDDVEASLADVAHAVVVDFDSTGRGVEPVYRDVAGAAPGGAPGDAVPWTARASGTGTQDLQWAVEDGDWTVVVMNADATAGVAADVAVGAELPATGWAVGLMAALGGLSVLVGGALTWGALHRRWSVRAR